MAHMDMVSALRSVAHSETMALRVAGCAERSRRPSSCWERTHRPFMTEGVLEQRS